jgi:hypothetical protein
MNRVQTDGQLLERVCRGNTEAMDFLAHYWSPYVHAIDDIIDGDKAGAEFILETFALAAQLYSHPFYLAHIAALRQVVLLVTNLYADSVAWERSAVKWQAQWADHNRHAGMEMVVAVAQICGGYAHARAISREQRCICYVEHHTPGGEPI